MKVHVKINGDVRLVVKYESDEWQKVEEKLKQLGLEKASTSQAWGSQENAEYYRESTPELLRAMQRVFEFLRVGQYSLIDSINKPFIDEDSSRYMNVAVFRVVPNAGGEVSVPVQKYLTLLEVKSVVQALGKVYEFLLNTATESDEFTITKKEA